MIVLACETSTLLGSVALLKDGQVLAYRDSVRQGSHSEILNVFIDQVLAEAQLELSSVDLFATGIGPGSFTGIRISLNTIKTLAYCFNKPCIGIDSLTNLATQFQLPAGENKEIVCLINAYKNMVYAATFKKAGGTLAIAKEPSVVRVQNLPVYIQNACYVVGDGFAAYKDYFEQTMPEKILRAPQASDEPHARMTGLIASTKDASQRLHWSKLLPIYLRESEAEENLKGIKYEPLF